MNPCCVVPLNDTNLNRDAFETPGTTPVIVIELSADELDSVASPNKELPAELFFQTLFCSPVPKATVEATVEDLKWLADIW